MISISRMLVIRFEFLTDFDECKVNNGGCEVLCVNTAGSFQCGCHEGQTLESNKINCSGEFMHGLCTTANVV